MIASQPAAKSPARSKQAGASAPSWLTPEELASLSSLELRARGVVEGFLQGLHRSPFVGFSVEFSSHRRYGPGDDLRHVNWKLFARNRKLYVKEFDAETNLNLYLLVDGSSSMHCKLAGSLSKFQYAATLAAALACLASQQRDAVAMGLMADGITAYLEPSAKPGRWEECLDMLSMPLNQAAEVKAVTSLAKSLGQAAALARHRGIVIVLSDLIDDASGIARGLQQLRHRGHEVVVFHILDPWERELPAEGRIRFADLESPAEITTDVESVRDSYNARINAWCAELQNLCLHQSIDRLEVLTDRPPTAALVDYLVARTR